MKHDQQSLDIIGDIHGAIGRFRGLIRGLGYEERGGRWSHPQGRGLVFLGDYIDRGPDSFGVYRTVRKMVDDGVAIALMGNHELNAIAFSTRANDGTLDARRAHADACEALRTGRAARGWHRRHEFTATKNGRRALMNLQHHRATLVSTTPEQYAEMVEWFVRLPLWLELPDLRAVHAAWIPSAVTTLRTWAVKTTRRNPGLDATDIPGQRAGPTTFAEAAAECQRRCSVPAEAVHQRAIFLLLDGSESSPSGDYAHAVETLLKGPELKLPRPLPDPEGTERAQFRIRWFDAFKDQTIREYWFGPKHAISTEGDSEQILARREILATRLSPSDVERASRDVSAGYGATERAVFFGHYGLRANELPNLGANWACLDYSAFHENGALAAYRFERGAVPNDSHGNAHDSASIVEHQSARRLCREFVLSESWLEREHPEHGKKVDASDEPPSGTQPPSRAQYALTLLSCDSDALVESGQRLAAEIARVDRETSAVLGIPRIWPDQLPASFGQAEPPEAMSEATPCAAEETILMPLDETLAAHIRAQIVRASTEENAVPNAVLRRNRLGLPVPQVV